MVCLKRFKNVSNKYEMMLIKSQKIHLGASNWTTHPSERSPIDCFGTPFWHLWAHFWRPGRVLGTTLGHPGPQTPKNLKKITFWDLISRSLFDMFFTFWWWCFSHVFQTSLLPPCASTWVPFGTTLGDFFWHFWRLWSFAGLHSLSSQNLYFQVLELPCRSCSPIFLNVGSRIWF